jgi:hypothetical protein
LETNLDLTVEISSEDDRDQEINLDLRVNLDLTVEISFKAKS